MPAQVAPNPALPCKGVSPTFTVAGVPVQGAAASSPSRIITQHSGYQAGMQHEPRGKGVLGMLSPGIN